MNGGVSVWMSKLWGEGVRLLLMGAPLRGEICNSATARA